MFRDQIEQGGFARLMKRVSGLRFERRRSVGEHGSQSWTYRGVVELRRVEQRLARLLDRVEHAERSGLASKTRGEIRLAVAREERMRVRVDKARNDHAIAQVDGVARGDLSRPNGYELAVFDDEHCIVDSAQGGEIDTALRSVRIARNDRPSADDQRRQSIPFASAVSIASS